MTLLTVLLLVLLPVVIVTVLRRIPAAAGINPIIAAYATGLLLAPFLPTTGEVAAVQDTLANISVALSIPLMLFSVDVRRWRRLGREAAVSLLLSIVAIAIAVTVGHLLLHRHLQESNVIAGLLVGVYTGGTPNLAAIRTALQVDTSLYLTVHTADIVVSAVYILFIVTLGKTVFDRILPPLPNPEERRAVRTVQLDFREILRRGNRRISIAALGLTVVVVALSLGVSLLFPAESSTVVVILALTTFALASTAIPGVTRLYTSFRMGEFVLLIFAVTVGSMAQIQEIAAASPLILLFVTIAVFGSLLIHLILARIFRISTEVLIVTSVAAICSPPFVGMVAPSIRNPQVIAAGITTGIIGYALGNYLGVLVVWSLGLFPV